MVTKSVKRVSKREQESHIENLRMAYAIMAGFPAHKVALGSWRDTDGKAATNDHNLLTHCGTTGCIAGVISAHPYFKKQGLKWSVKTEELSFKGQYSPSWYISEELFGDVRVFEAGLSGVPGKKQALSRIRYVLFGKDAISPQRNAELATQEAQIKD